MASLMLYSNVWEGGGGGGGGGGGAKKGLQGQRPRGLMLRQSRLVVT